MRSAMFALAAAETKLLLRNTTVAITAVGVPLVMSLFVATSFGGNARMWGFVLALQMLSVLSFTVYFAVTAAITSRREDRYLKRLCSAEPGPLVVLGGTLLPSIVLGLAQAVIILIVDIVSGAGMPSNLVLLAVALLGGTAMCVAAGLATTAFTSSSEHAQITILPFFMALFGGAVWVSVSQETSPLMLALPGGAVAELVHLSMSGGAWLDQMTAALPALGMLLVWIIVPTLLARQTFRWEPRT